MQKSLEWVAPNIFVYGGRKRGPAMAGARKKPLKSGKYQAWYTNYSGKQTFFVGTNSRRETFRAANRFEEEHRKIALGELPVPDVKRKYRAEPIKKLAAKYLAWGKVRGRKDGKPWSKRHAAKTETNLEYWIKVLKLKTVADLDGVLSGVQDQIVALAVEKKKPKTVSNIVTSLQGLCTQAVKWHYLDLNPLDDLGRLDTTAEKEYRALARAEVGRLFDVAPDYRRLLYIAAMITGLRAGELRSLTTDDLDPDGPGLHLRPEWTKNRKKGYMPLPVAFAKALLAGARSGETLRLYDRYNRKIQVPTNALLFVPTHTARTLDADRIKAKIPKETKDGVVAFHSLRASFVTLVTEQGATVKETQKLARHSDPRLTMNTYAKTRDHREAEVIDGVFRSLESAPKNAYSMRAKVEDEKKRVFKALKPTGTDNGRGFESPRLQSTRLMVSPLFSRDLPFSLVRPPSVGCSIFAPKFSARTLSATLSATSSRRSSFAFT